MPKIKFFLPCALIAGAFSVQAQSTVTQQLHDINQQRILLEAQLKRAELQKKLMETQAEMSALGGSRRAPARTPGQARAGEEAQPPATPLASASLPASASVVPPAPSEPELPTVAAVEGLKGALSATLLFKGHMEQRVKAGDTVAGGVIETIELDRVMVRDPSTGKLSALRFSSANAPREASPFTNNFPNAVSFRPMPR